MLGYVGQFIFYQRLIPDSGRWLGCCLSVVIRIAHGRQNMVISLEDYRARRLRAAARPVLRLAAVGGGASATVATPALLMPWQASPAGIRLSQPTIDPRLLYADATLI